MPREAYPPEVSGGTVRRARVRAGLSQERCAELLGIHRSRVQRYEAARAPRWYAWALAGLLRSDHDRATATLVEAMRSAVRRPTD